MSSRSLDEEREAIDLVTGSMFGLGFLREISALIASGQGDRISVQEYYQQWLQVRSPKEQKIPFNPGTIVGYLYCGLGLTKEIWQDLIPNVPSATAPPEWRIHDIAVAAPLQPNPTVRYVIRRLRNAIGHARVEIEIPDGITVQTIDNVKFTFHDVDPRNSSDTFKAVATLGALIRVISTFHGVIVPSVRRKVAQAGIAT